MFLVVGFDFNFVTVNDELGAEAERLALQDQVDLFDGLISLLPGRAVGDLIRVELKINATDGDDFHLMGGEFSTKRSSA